MKITLTQCGFLVCAVVFAGGCGGGQMAPLPASITETGGTPQSATVNSTFATQFQATVKDSSNKPVSGATVTFSAPGSGASGTFAGGVTTATTNASGVATAAVFTANTVAGSYTVTASVSGVSSPANFSLTNLAGAAASVTATGGTPQSAATNTPFATQFQVTVKDSSNNPVSGASVTFAAPSSGASGTFAGGVNTAVTNASGVATAPVFTANTTAGGPYTVTASVSGVASPATFSLTNAPITVSVNPPVAAIGTGQTTPFTVTTNDPNGVVWSVSAGTIDGAGNFTAPSGQSTTVTVIATSVADSTKSGSATVNVVAPGTVATTANVQVALYTISPAAAGNVSVQFGLDTTYGLTTWTQPVPQGGGAVPIFVAGMKANTPYHMRGVVQFADGSTFMDADQTFMTQAIPAASLPVITTTTTAGMTPQSGVEMLQDVAGNMALVPVLMTDLSGNVLWGYNPGPLGIVNPVKLLPNGHFLMNFSQVGGNTDGSGSTMQEVDLTGQVVWQMTAAQLNTALAAATCAGCNISVVGTHHDFVMLPNGHLIVIAATQETISGTVVTGDVVIDLTQNFNSSNPATVNWLWNEFDPNNLDPNHLDVNRQPMGFPDWTHTNAVIYSSDDQNLIVSIRHQNWLVKFNYAGGTGDGHILWKLGYQGDFTLLNPDGTPDTNAMDWFFAQHGPSFVTTNTTGKFSLILFDNGDDRGTTVVGNNGSCGVAGQPTCFSTVPLLQLDETVSPMTAILAFNPTTPNYSGFGGNAAVMKNGNVEFCESAVTSYEGAVYEWTQGSNPQIVWQLLESGQFMYRGQRLPSLYPGVQW